MPRMKEEDREKIEIGNNLRLKREEAGLSQSQLADMLGEDRNVVYRYEAGTTQMGIIEAAKIAKILHTTVDALIPEQYRVYKDASSSAGDLIETRDSFSSEMEPIYEMVAKLTPEQKDLFYIMTEGALKNLLNMQKLV